MKQISEEMKIHEEWYKEARDKDMSLEKLSSFLKRIAEEYQHDYGTICHALTAGAMATIYAMNRTKQGGITGFQASCIMWEFMKRFNGIDPPARLIEYRDMLYPQHKSRFEKTISSSTFEFLKKEANRLLTEDCQYAVEDVVSHWKSIANGEVPFGYTIKD